MIYDLVIIGSSAAGISAAIYLKRRGVNFLLLGKDIGGEMALSGEVDNYPGIPKITGIELTKKFNEHLKKYGVEAKAAEITEINRTEKFFIVKANDIEESAKSIIIATGSKPKKLNVPGETIYYHKGVSYCTLCDGPLFRDKPVAIIGGGNSALEAGLMLAQFCPKVHILTINNKMLGDEILIKELTRQKNVSIETLAFTRGIIGDDKGFVRAVKYLDKKSSEIKEIEVKGVFIHIGMKPNSDFIPSDWKIKNEFGEIIIDKFCKTSIPGIFAAGDVSDIPYKQIGIAVGQGITAALSAVSYLNSNSGL